MVHRSNLENQLHKKRCEYDKAAPRGCFGGEFWGVRIWESCDPSVADLWQARAQLQKMQETASQFSTLERELKCKEHEFLSRSESGESPE